MSNYCWILYFVVIVSAIAISLLAAILNFLQYLNQKRVFYSFSHGKLLTWFLMRIWALLGAPLPTAWIVIFHFQCASCMFNYFMYFIQLASKIKPDFVSLHLLWWQKAASEYMNKGRKNSHLPWVSCNIISKFKDHVSCCFFTIFFYSTWYLMWLLCATLMCLWDTLLSVTIFMIC